MSFNADPASRRYTDGILEEIALNYSFQSVSLMNCILALSALHIKRKKIAGDPALISLLAHEYINASTSQILTDMEVADPKTFPHLVVASLLMTAISSEQFRDERFGANLFILNWMKIWCGIGIMMERITIPGLIRCGLSSLFYRPPLNLDASKDNIPEVLQIMVDLDPDDPDNHAVYREALRCLDDETWEHEPARVLTPEEMLHFETRDIYVDRGRATVPQGPDNAAD
ncbi:Fungal transcriptional regulatory protein [Cordyceps fumosorosea ARSEF 2679]|uniref:Fungal transcriptional regulatory protein n=1 Tax=Cordyceps fumosorosea (strain ARSEF 2679) TaxID=1081104 RepID=A0A167RQ72_CORFA|nr:Fungal transcriptional regulatory protein [Cordyceps fumosorosea ARSEF 2679]OAA58823.1 Fungal transcriptional regulatory protein [Cordyceps fumosorosea ARSEF 2679]